MAKRGKPIKYNSLDEWREAQRKRSKKYYDENREVILAKAKMKRRKAKEQQNKNKEGEM